MSERAAVKLILRHKKTGDTREIEVPFGGTFDLDKHEEVDWQTTQGHYWRRVDALERQLAEAQGKLDAEIEVVIIASKGAPDDSYWRGRLSGLLFVRDRILKGE